MNLLLKIPIECGEKTCASEPGKFCRYFGSKKFGQVPVCLLFPEENPITNVLVDDQELYDKDGWTQRCKQCLRATMIRIGLDENGAVWFYSPESQCVVVEDDYSEDGGYHCESLEEAKRMLADKELP